MLHEENQKQIEETLAVVRKIAIRVNEYDNVSGTTESERWCCYTWLECAQAALSHASEFHEAIRPRQTKPN